MLMRSHYHKVQSNVLHKSIQQLDRYLPALILKFTVEVTPLLLQLLNSTPQSGDGFIRVITESVLLAPHVG